MVPSLNAWTGAISSLTAESHFPNDGCLPVVATLLYAWVQSMYSAVLLMSTLHVLKPRRPGRQLSPEYVGCRATIYDDSFIRQYIDDLLKNIRTQVVMKLIEPYTLIRIPFVSKELNIPAPDVEQLLVSLILDNRIQGHIDQVRTCVQHQSL